QRTQVSSQSLTKCAPRAGSGAPCGPGPVRSPASVSAILRSQFYPPFGNDVSAIHILISEPLLRGHHGATRTLKPSRPPGEARVCNDGVAAGRHDLHVLILGGPLDHVVAEVLLAPLGVIRENQYVRCARSSDGCIVVVHCWHAVETL